MKFGDIWEVDSLYTSTLVSSSIEVYTTNYSYNQKLNSYVNSHRDSLESLNTYQHYNPPIIPSPPHYQALHKLPPPGQAALTYHIPPCQSHRTLGTDLSTPNEGSKRKEPYHLAFSKCMYI